jgi:hypothetical protein
MNEPTKKEVGAGSENYLITPVPYYLTLRE